MLYMHSELFSLSKVGADRAGQRQYFLKFGL